MIRSRRYKTLPFSTKKQAVAFANAVGPRWAAEQFKTDPRNIYRWVNDLRFYD